MRRSARTVQRKIIVLSSDSETELGNVSNDDNYVPDENMPAINKKRKNTIISNNDASTHNVKKKPNTVLLPESKKRKIISESKSNNSESEYKNSAESVEKKRKEEILESTLKLDLKSVECKDWTDVDYLNEVNNIDKCIAKNVVELFNKDNTIPFIARYRRNMTGGMEPAELRVLKESFDHAKLIKQRAATILKTIDKLGQWSPNIHAAIVSSKSIEDLEHIYSVFKPASKGTLAERAKEVGLGSVSNDLLNGKRLPHLSSLVNPAKEGLKTEQQIVDGIIHIIADTINKSKAIFDRVKELQNEAIIRIQTAECKTSKSATSKEKDENRKYEMYYDFNATTKTIKPHQILAINRAEAQKILNVKIIVPDFLQKKLKNYCVTHYKEAILASEFHARILNDSIDYAYSKFIKSLVVRRVRNEMKQRAEIASIEVFVTNVKQLLLTPPVRGKIILGIDPGFSHGCKLAVISEHGNVIETGVIYPHQKVRKSYEQSADVLISLVKRHKATILSLGNATACRETEVFLNELIKSKAFGSMDISYAIVDEAGASIYSCSPVAKAEFPNLDTNVISAISIARRLQDPLAELVKVEPKHLGVGMYQHDLPEKQLSAALNEVVSEAVSFVGVDVNTASQCLLKRVAGLNASRADSIIQWRTDHGSIMNRQQLLEVKGIGSKTFEQCAGFIRILPETSMIDNSVKSKRTKSSKQVPNLLDQTWIHPESYKIAERFLVYCGCKLEDLGTSIFIEKIKSFANEGCDALAKKFNTDETTMDIIVKGLSMKKDEDIRLKTNSPLFRKNMLSIKDISTGSMLTGAVRNVTHFGAFVDVGVGRDGLIPNRWMNCTLSIGQPVEVKVLSVDLNRNRINLELIKVL